MISQILQAAFIVAVFLAPIVLYLEELRKHRRTKQELALQRGMVRVESRIYDGTEFHMVYLSHKGEIYSFICEETSDGKVQLPSFERRHPQLYEESRRLEFYLQKSQEQGSMLKPSPEPERKIREVFSFRKLSLSLVEE